MTVTTLNWAESAIGPYDVTVAKPLSQDDFELVKAHLAKFPNQSPCPICSTGDWNVSGLEAALAVESNGLNPTTVMPVVALVCATCGFVRHFAWTVIKPGISDHNTGKTSG